MVLLRQAQALLSYRTQATRSHTLLYPSNSSLLPRLPHLHPLNSGVGISLSLSLCLSLNRSLSPSLSLNRKVLTNRR